MHVGRAAGPEPTIREGEETGESDTPVAPSSAAPPSAVPPTAPRPPALSERLPTPWLFPLLAFAAAWGIILAAWQVANAIYGVSWAWWNKYFLYQDGGHYNWLAIHAY